MAARTGSLLTGGDREDGTEEMAGRCLTEEGRGEKKEKEAN